MESSSTVPDPYAAAREKLDRENPRSWIWDEDGDEIAGFYQGADTWTQRDGTEVPVRLVKTRNGYRAIWLFESPQDLRRVFDEHDPEVGDYVIVRRLPRREFTAANGERRKFVPFEMAVIPAAETAEPSDSDCPESPERAEHARAVHRPLELGDEPVRADDPSVPF
jgi:hypothetical protein